MWNDRFRENDDYERNGVWNSRTTKKDFGPRRLVCQNYFQFAPHLHLCLMCRTLSHNTNLPSTTVKPYHCEFDMNLLILSSTFKTSIEEIIILKVAQ